MNPTTTHPAVAALLADVEALVLRRLAELLPAAASAATSCGECGESIAARNARWLALFDSLPDRKGRLSRAAQQIAVSEGVKVETVRKAIGTAARQRQPGRYGSSRPRPDTLTGCWR